jgi:hypothetical protein
VSDALQPVSQDELDHLVLGPIAAYSTPTRDARLTVTRGKHLRPLTLAGLPDLQRAMKSGLAMRFPEASWQSNELMEINGRNWIHFDFTTNVKDKSVRSALYVTSFDGDQLQFLLQAEGASGAQSWTELEACGRTLQIE